MRNNKHMRDNTKYSSYWLKDDLFDDDTDISSPTETKHSNLIALASYKRAISNFVNIVTGENIKVIFNQRGDNSYTDGKTVTISAKMDDKDFDPTVGVLVNAYGFGPSKEKIDLNSFLFRFCSTSLPLTCTRWVQSTNKLLFALSTLSKQCCCR